MTSAIGWPCASGKERERWRCSRRSTCVGAAASRVRGFTLIEVILTMSLLVILGAVFWSNLAVMKESSRLDRTADDLRGLIIGLRVRAIEEAQTYTVAFTPDTPQFEVSTGVVQAAATGAQPTAAQGAAEATDEYTPRLAFDSKQIVGQHRLETGITFVSSGETGADGASGTKLILYPDGSMTDTDVSIADEKGFAVTLSTRGLAGTVRASAPARRSDLADRSTKERQ